MLVVLKGRPRLAGDCEERWRMGFVRLGGFGFLDEVDEKNGEEVNAGGFPAALWLMAD